MEDEHYRAAAHALMLKEQAPTLKVKGVDLAHYADLLIARYSNPALRHRTWQIAMDGSQKLPQRMLDSVRWHWSTRNPSRCWPSVWRAGCVMSAVWMSRVTRLR